MGIINVVEFQEEPQETLLVGYDFELVLEAGVDV